MKHKAIIMIFTILVIGAQVSMVTGLYQNHQALHNFDNNLK